MYRASISALVQFRVIFYKAWVGAKLCIAYLAVAVTRCRLLRSRFLAFLYVRGVQRLGNMSEM